MRTCDRGNIAPRIPGESVAGVIVFRCDDLRGRYNCAESQEADEDGDLMGLHKIDF